MIFVSSIVKTPEETKCPVGQSIRLANIRGRSGARVDVLSGAQAGGPAWMQQMLGWQLAAPLPAMMQPMPSIPPSMPPSMPPPLPQMPVNPHACKSFSFSSVCSKLFGTTGEPPVILVSSIVKTSFGNETPGLTKPTLSKHPHALRSAR